jgi:hypothetical protein
MLAAVVVNPDPVIGGIFAVVMLTLVTISIIGPIIYFLTDRTSSSKLKRLFKTRKIKNGDI